MSNKRVRKAFLSLMLSCSLLMGTALSVTADTGAEVQKELSLQSETAEPEQSGENGHRTEAGQSEPEAEGSVDDAAAAGQSSDSPDIGEADGSADTGNEQTEAGDPAAEKENPEDTPYEELLSDENLIVVTLDQDGSESGEVLAMEAVEDLSEEQITALETYIEDQGYAATAEAMLDAAADTQVRTVTFNMNGFISMEAEGYGTGYDAMFYVDPANYQGNGNAYCIDPSKQAPGHAAQGQKISYTTTVQDYRDPMLLKILYYGFGGLGDITGSHASTGPARHILTHMAAVKRAAELGIPGAGDYTYRANTLAVQKADALYQAIQSQEEVLGRASVLTPVEGQQTILLLAEYSRREIPKTTDLSVTKTVSGSGGSRNTEFHFQLQLSSENEKLLPEQIACVRTQAGEGEEKLTVQREELKSSGDKKTAVYSFALYHGQELKFQELPVGLEYSVTETDGEAKGYQVSADHAQGILKKGQETVSFRNNKEMIIPTGLDTDTVSGTVLLLTGLVLTASLLMGRKKYRNTGR